MLSPFTRCSPPRKYSAASVDDVDDEIARYFRSILVRPRVILERGDLATFYGPEGAGKSHTVAALHNALAAAGWLVHWAPLVAYPDDFQDAKAAAEEMTSAPILVLDDLGREPERTRRIFAPVLYARLERERPTFITTNLAIEADTEECTLSKMYGRAARSRILGGNVFFVDGHDRRLN